MTEVAREFSESRRVTHRAVCAIFVMSQSPRRSAKRTNAYTQGGGSAGGTQREEIERERARDKGETSLVVVLMRVKTREWGRAVGQRGELTNLIIFPLYFLNYKIE